MDKARHRLRQPSPLGQVSSGFLQKSLERNKREIMSLTCWKTMDNSQGQFPVRLKMDIGGCPERGIPTPRRDFLKPPVNPPLFLCDAQGLFLVTQELLLVVHVRP